ncbi:hypothetical protein [Thalassotalea atypica]|uniref:hypothetical protein n=1 Tax=Thalassotalea atypica TaxID=2054316 RepID=UPI002573898B|nr:hypothetical protein [Thalassotalea atypica]
MDSSDNLSQEQSEQRRKSRRSFIFVCLAFIVPIILAKMALEQQWFNYGVTNQGQLLDKELHLKDLGLNQLHDKLPEGQKPWLLVYNLPSKCEQQCIQLFNGLSNTYIALGKDMKRVNLVGVLNSELSEQQYSTIDIKRWTMTTLAGHAQLPQELAPVFVVDPLGNVVVSHQPPASADELPSFGKSILADFKVLLKLSRIG